MRGIYLHRCGIALTQPYTAFTHAICHTNIYDTRTNAPDDAITNVAGAPTMFIQGGYHDAGDMDQTAAHYQISILMLSFFEAFPGQFVDGQYNIPESGNGVPDFLDEIMWGVKVWEYLQVTNNPSDPDYGGVRAGWAPGEDTYYGYEDAANDPHLYGTFNVRSDCTAMAAGIFAHASRLIRNYDPVHANVLSNQAQLAWTYLVGHTNVNEPRVGFMYAALQLYLLTGNSSYHQIFATAATNVVINRGKDANGNGFYSSDEGQYYWPGDSEAICTTAHFVSYLLNNGRSTDPVLAQNLKDMILYYAQNGTEQGPPPDNLPYPQGVTSGMGWGTGTAEGAYAEVWMYGCLFTNDPATLQLYTNRVSQYADFPLGLNPMNMSYYTGLGTDQPNVPADCNSYFTRNGLSDGVQINGAFDYHTNSAGLPIGNVPGICIYGPSDGTIVAATQEAVWKKVWPASGNLPPQHRFAHGNTLYLNDEFTVHQTMAPNAVMYAFLYTPRNSRPATTAARATGPITIDGILSEAGWTITNMVTKPIIGTPNNTVTFGVLWDDTYLYVGAKVLDATLISDSAPYPWQDDAIEIYIDGDHDRGTSYDSHDRQIVQGWNYPPNSPSIWVNGNQTSGILHAFATITGGYSVEVAIPWTNFGITPSAGTVIGFDVANDDDDTGGLRQSQLMWAGTANNWTDTSAFGDLTRMAVS